MVYCTSCGAENPADAKFCHRCGKTVFVSAKSSGRPSIMLVAVVGLQLALVQAVLLFVVPVFAAMFADFGAKLPWATGALLAVAGFWKSWWWLANPAGGLLVVTFLTNQPEKFPLRLALHLVAIALFLFLLFILAGLALPIVQLGRVAGGIS